MESLPGLVKVGMWISLPWPNESQCSPAVQFSPKCNSVVKTVHKTSYQIIGFEIVLLKFPANIMSNVRGRWG